MTVNEALGKASDIIGEISDRTRFTEWLSEIENTVCSEIALTHEGANPDLSLITSETDGNRELFVPDPSSSLYVLYLIMKNDLYLRDTEQYANSKAAFEAAYAAFADKYNREHMPGRGCGICL